MTTSALAFPATNSNLLPPVAVDRSAAQRPLIRTSVATWSDGQAGSDLRLRPGDSTFVRVTTLVVSGFTTGGIGHFTLAMQIDGGPFRLVRSVEHPLTFKEHETIVQLPVRTDQPHCILVGLFGEPNDRVTSGVAQFEHLRLEVGGKAASCNASREQPAECGFQAAPVGIGNRRRGIIVPGCAGRFQIYPLVLGRPGSPNLSGPAIASDSLTRHSDPYGNRIFDIGKVIGMQLILVPDDSFREDVESRTILLV